ncbi:MAG TPA: hypothetical protein DER09_02930 [Prolixibacteraceae bacterium]|nr:hypothetical protein [Prolixibacteraceae bacterium]
MKKLTEWLAVAAMLLSMTIFNGCNTYRPGTYETQTSYENPQWGPSYYNGTRYYYLPDIECYYDMYTREFIFLNQAQWIYSPYLPSMYSNFDLNNSFIVVVNSNIYQPWMHHQYYVSHFPRYYYRDYYDHSNIPYVRGFNENSRSAIYWTENERDRARSWDDENLRTGRQFRYSKEDRLQQRDMSNSGVNRRSTNYRYDGDNSRNNSVNTINQSENPVNSPVIRQPQNENNRGTSPKSIDNTSRPQPANTPEERKPHNTNYYGVPIGQPVKVDRQMRIQNTTGTSGRSNNNTESQKNSSENKKPQSSKGRK